MLVALLSLSLAAPVYETVIRNSRTSSNLKNSGRSITIIQPKASESLGDALREVPGLTVTQSGASGQTESLFIRGADSKHTQVFIDGVLVNDPSSPSRSFDFSKIPLENIEKIEVIRVSQSVISGSDAIGGVIHIFTKKGSQSNQARANIEYGFYNRLHLEASLRGQLKESLHYSLSAARYSTDGFSSAAEKHGNTEADGSELNSFSVRMGGEPWKWLELDGSTKVSSNNVDLDDRGGPGGDDPNHRLHQKTAQPKEKH